MIQKISHILKTAQAKSSQGGVFNARLPISILVLKKLGGSKYLLQVGTKQIQTSSQTNLQIGQKYWANMGSLRGMGGSQIVLNSLTPQPKILDFAQKFDAEFVLDSENLEQILKDSELFKGLGEFSVSRLADSKSKAEFEYFSFVLLGLQKRVASFLIEDGGKRGVLQIKRGVKEISFCACMPSLGVIQGAIRYLNSQNSLKMSLHISCNFESTKTLLESTASELEGFESIAFSTQKTLEPFFTPNQSDNLLNIMG